MVSNWSQESKNRIEKELFEFIDRAGDSLRVVFREDLRGGEVASVQQEGDVTVLFLAEPKCQKDLDEWLDVIIKAQELNEMHFEEVLHQSQSTNYFKSILAKFRISKIRKQYKQ